MPKECDIDLILVINATNLPNEVGKRSLRTQRADRREAQMV